MFCKNAPWYWPFHNWAVLKSEQMEWIEHVIRYGDRPDLIGGNIHNRVHLKKCRNCYLEHDGIELYKSKVKINIYKEKVDKAELELLENEPKLHSLIRIIESTSDKNGALLYVKNKNLYIQDVCKRILGV
jgi:hypothetical protein